MEQFVSTQWNSVTGCHPSTCCTSVTHTLLQEHGGTPLRQKHLP